MFRLKPVRSCLPLILASLLILSACRSEAQPEPVTLITADGYRIDATLTRPADKPTNNAGVILLPMYRRTKESWQPLVEKLVARGMTTLALDLRGHGQSNIAPDGSDASRRVIDRDPQFFGKMHLDAEAAITFLKEHEGIDSRRTALVGASVGCSVAIQTATIKPVKAVVVLTPGRDYLGIPTMEHIKHWPGTPLLILTSNEEAGRGAKAIYERLKNKGAELKTFDQDDIHGTNMFGEVAEVENLITNWLAEQLGI